MAAVQNTFEVEHPLLVRRLAAAVMNWPLVSALASLALVLGITAALGWAAVGGVARLVG